MVTVVVQKWEESELGWGVRPDGYSLHLSEAGRDAYINRYWESMPDSAPQEYERPCGSPYLADVPEEVAAKIRASNDGFGYRVYDNVYPGSGGTDGWVNASQR